MTFQSAKNLKPHLALRKAVEINQKLDQSCLKLFCYTGGKQLYPYLKIGQLPYVTWNLKLLLGWVHALATQKDAQCSPALEGTRWERHLKSTPLNISRAIAAKIAAKSLQEPLQRKGQLVLCLEDSNQNKTKQALFGLLSVYGMRLVTNNSQEMRRPYVWLQHLRSNFTPLVPTFLITSLQGQDICSCDPDPQLSPVKMKAISLGNAGNVPYDWSLLAVRIEMFNCSRTINHNDNTDWHGTFSHQESIFMLCTFFSYLQYNPHSVISVNDHFPCLTQTSCRNKKAGASQKKWHKQMSHLMTTYGRRPMNLMFPHPPVCHYNES